MWLTYCNILSCLEDEFRWELVNNGSTRAHLPLYLPVAQRLVLRRDKNTKGDDIITVAFYNNKMINKQVQSMSYHLLYALLYKKINK